MKTLLSLVVIAAGLAFLWQAGGWHILHQPTPDELYGCTLKQQAPNGDCP